MSIDSTQQKICLFGAFGVGNLGNECTLQALLYNLRKYMPNAEITCLCSGPEEVASSYHISALPIRDSPLLPVKSKAVRLLRRIFVGISLEVRRWSRAYRTLKGVDMLVMTGTGMLGDVGISPFGLHYDILKWSIIAKLRRCKLLFVSVGVGPIKKPLSKLFVKAALALADYRSYRDAFSKEYLEGLHFDTKGDNVCPDLAFSLPKTMIPSSRCHDEDATVIGVGIITYSQRRANLRNDEFAYRNYIQKLSVFVTWLLEQRYTVRLLIGDAVYDHRARQDLKAVLEVAGIDYAQGKIIDEPASSVAEVLSQLAGTDLVVASRFHNVLLALWLNKPVVAISFHEKVDSLMSAVGLTAFCQDIEHIDTNKLIAQFIALQQNAGNLKFQIEQRREAYQVALDEQYEHIFGDI